MKLNVSDKVMWMEDVKDNNYSIWNYGTVLEVSDKYKIKSHTGDVVVLDVDEVMPYEESIVGELPDSQKEMFQPDETINYKQAYENVFDDICKIADYVLGKKWAAEDAIDSCDVSRQIVKAVKKAFKEKNDMLNDLIADIDKGKKKKRKLSIITHDEDEDGIYEDYEE